MGHVPNRRLIEQDRWAGVADVIGLSLDLFDTAEPGASDDRGGDGGAGGPGGGGDESR